MAGAYKYFSGTLLGQLVYIETIRRIEVLVFFSLSLSKVRILEEFCTGFKKRMNFALGLFS